MIQHATNNLMYIYKDEREKKHKSGLRSWNDRREKYKF